MKEKNYYGFSDWKDVGNQFGADVGTEPKFVYAVYNTPAYEGNAIVVFCRDGKWFEASGSHCSCYGLEEGGWHPKPIDPALHLTAIAEGRHILLIADTEGDYQEATQDNFDAWLGWTIQSA